MATSDRNQLGVGGTRKLSALEAQLNEADLELHGAQPFGALDGRYYQVTTSDLIQHAGTRWVHTMVDGDSDAAQTVAVQDPTATLPPFLRIITNDKADDSNQIQFGIAKTLGSTTVTAFAPFVAKAGYDINFKMRFSVNTGAGSGTVSKAVILAGLSVVDTTLLASHVIGTTDFIGFYKAAATAMKGVVRTSSTSTSTDPVSGGFTPTISTYYDIGFKLVGRTEITYFANGSQAGSTTMTNLPANTVVLTPSIAVGTSDGNAVGIDIQAIYVGQEAR